MLLAILRAYIIEIIVLLPREKKKRKITQQNKIKMKPTLSTVALKS